MDWVYVPQAIVPKALTPHPQVREADASEEKPCDPRNASSGELTMGDYRSSCPSSAMLATSLVISIDTMANSLQHWRCRAPASAVHAELSWALP